jgi:hypothetical protein
MWDASPAKNARGAPRCARCNEELAMMSKWSAGAAVAVAAMGMVWAQQQPAMNARELFYSPPPTAQAHTPARSARAARNSTHRSTKATSPSPVSEAPSSQEAKNDTAPAVPVVLANYSQVPLGLRYSVLKRDSDGQYREVDPDSVFHSGDKIRLNVEANDSAYLYIVMKGSSGKWLPLFPSRQIAGGSNRVEKGRLYEIPSGAEGRFTFDENPGEEKLFLVLSRKPDEDFEKLVYRISSGGSGAKSTAEPATSGNSQPLKVLMAANMAPINDDLIGRIRSQFVARDLVFEKVDDATPGPKKEAAMYVVSPDRSPGARLVVDLKLKHQ